ncbi:YjeO family protein [Xenorhabdus bovienii]|uniref:DUF2645 family protein n=1 Tax=Xenorhabdus bovienii TaxID=40576 RepID=UPI0023B2DF13|nr:DUF2645 family protein [Xenorhabdus bovienii]MDE9519919.1 YjeO family protein [Xenorhabdus bovienii]
MKKITTIIYSTYYICCLFIIYLLSFFEEEVYIDGKEIKNSCIAHRALVVDDIRDITAPISILYPSSLKMLDFSFVSDHDRAHEN